MTTPSPAQSESEWLRRAETRLLLRDERTIGSILRGLLLLVALAAWRLADSPLPALPFLLPWLLLSGGALALFLMQRAAGEEAIPAQRRWRSAGLALDLLLVLLALVADGRPESDLYLLLLIPALKATLLYPDRRVVALVPAVLVSGFALLLVLLAGRPAILLEAIALRRAALLLLVAVPMTVLGSALHRARHHGRLQELRLAQRRTELDTRTQVLTQTATNLANRVLELRSLQEGIKAINASLELSVLLDQIVENASDVFGGAGCAIALLEADGTVAIAARSRESAPGDHTAVDGPPLESLAGRVVRGATPVLENHPLPGDDRLRTVMAVPLIADGEPLGALLASRIADFPFIPDDQQRLASFADQAALAVKNSRLYAQVARLYQTVKERSEEIEAVLSSIGDAVIVTDPDGTVALTNPVATEILGLPDLPAGGAPLPESVLRRGFEAHLRTTMENRSGDPVLGELVVHGGGLQGEQTFQALSAPLRAPSGAPRGVVTVLRDVTASKQLEQLKSNFVGTISHELKTPLHSIKGFVDIILSEKSTGALTDLQRDFLGTVRDQTQRLERMILDLLEFSHLESGQIRLRPEPLDLALLGQSVTEQLRSVAGAASVTLDCDIVEPLPVEGDRLRLEQVLNNLIANAIKFTSPGGRVTVGGHAGAKSVTVSVRDTGIGIPADEVERIFERFYQVDASQSRQFGGTGLGLAICRHIVQRHGGRIWVESEVGRGSTFFFALPQELSSATPLVVDFSRLEGEPRSALPPSATPR